MATSVTYKRYNGKAWEELYFPYEHSHSWGSITSKPSWIGSSKPSYAASEISTTDGITVQAALSNFASSLNGKANSSHTHNYLPLAGGNITGHIYLTGAKESSSTGNTSQIVFGTSSTNHVALSSNNNALVINPTSSATANQIVLYLDKQSMFPSGITSSGTINGKTLQENGTSLSSKYQAKGNYLSTGDVSFTQTLTSGTAIGTISINGTSKTLYAPSSSGGGSGGGYGEGDSPTFNTVTCDNLTVTANGGATIQRLYVSASGYFAGSCNFTGGIYISGTPLDTYIRNLIG